MEGVQQGSDKQAADDGERMSEFCRELARLMRERGTGVRELARLVPCNPGHVSNLRNGKARPSPELAQILDDILGAGGALAALAAAGSRPGPVGDLQLIELARRAEASDLGVGTLELLAVSTDRLCRAQANLQRRPPMGPGHQSLKPHRPRQPLLPSRRNLWCRFLEHQGARSFAKFFPTFPAVRKILSGAPSRWSYG